MRRYEFPVLVLLLIVFFGVPCSVRDVKISPSHVSPYGIVCLQGPEYTFGCHVNLRMDETGVHIAK